MLQSSWKEMITRNMPGKAGCVKSIAGERSKNTIPTGYLSTLCQKLVSKNPRMKLSFTSFGRIRRKLMTSFIIRDTCLCTKHQNMSLTLKAVKSQDINTSVNGEQLLDNKQEILQTCFKN